MLDAVKKSMPCVSFAVVHIMHYSVIDNENSVLLQLAYKCCGRAVANSFKLEKPGLYREPCDGQFEELKNYHLKV
jgi:hypothetical protein